ncbi:SCAN domain-containing protein 3-like [Oopsacas minuta]|uniref:SCAN domain-containing protein 3-like n=1 Tax=Oopsacas minuta TaxID=111878 RepID=A0AAV7JDJ9_9METZ|nr:SCAN domain-containing protein 3-like [Oopsacas minuta]
MVIHFHRYENSIEFEYETVPTEATSHHSPPGDSKNDRALFKLKETGLIRVNLGSSGALHKQAKSIVHASYAIAQLVAKNKKPYTIGETLVKPCILECARIVLNKDAISKLERISMSNDTIKSRIVDMSNNINI